MACRSTPTATNELNELHRGGRTQQVDPCNTITVQTVTRRFTHSIPLRAKPTKQECLSSSTVCQPRCSSTLVLALTYFPYTYSRKSIHQVPGPKRPPPASILIFYITYICSCKHAINHEIYHLYIYIYIMFYTIKIKMVY